MTSAETTRQLVDHLFRTRAGEMVAWLTRAFGSAHLDLAEEVVQDALIRALQQWPFSGVPDNPSGWLYRVARNQALDVLRRDASFRDRAGEVAFDIVRSAELRQDAERHRAAIRDDELRLVFLCCHPALSEEARVALSLKTAGGFSTAEIARAFLVSEPTIAQRIVRAKRVLRDEQVPFTLPSGRELQARLDSVLEVVYLMFNEGYSAHAGEELIREDLCEEALRLARLVAGAPDTSVPAAHALAALLAFQAARIPARVDASGEMVLLEEQDRRRWNGSLVALGFAHLERSAAGERMTAYHLQAAIAAVHARGPDADSTDWPTILELYDELLAINPSPVVALNRVVAFSRVAGAHAALPVLAELEANPSLACYYLLPAVKAALLQDTGDHAGAAAAYRAAAALPCSAPERRFLARRLHGLRG